MSIEIEDNLPHEYYINNLKNNKPRPPRTNGVWFEDYPYSKLENSKFYLIRFFRLVKIIYVKAATNAGINPVGFAWAVAAGVVATIICIKLNII